MLCVTPSRLVMHQVGTLNIIMLSILPQVCVRSTCLLQGCLNAASQPASKPASQPNSSNQPSTCLQPTRSVPYRGYLCSTSVPSATSRLQAGLLPAIFLGLIQPGKPSYLGHITHVGLPVPGAKHINLQFCAQSL